MKASVILLPLHFILKTKLFIMTISENKFVSLTYELRENDINGKQIESVNEENALSFVFGKGYMLEAFEANIKGLNLNDTFSFGLKAEQAYGPVYENARADVPKEVFMNEGKIDENILFVDNYIPMQDKDGHVFQGKVVAIENHIVTMDFNHPLAGVDLYFTGKVIGLREATADELNPPHNHDHSCGCGCEH